MFTFQPFCLLIVDEIETITTLITPSGKHFLIKSDPGDHMIIDCAVASRCHLIITGDNDLLADGKYLNIDIMIPSAFIDYFEQEKNKK